METRQFIAADGSICYASSVQGLDDLDLTEAKQWGGQGFDKAKVDRAMTPLGPSASMAVNLAFDRCNIRGDGGSGRVIFTLHRLEDQNLKRVNVSLPAFQVAR